MRGFSYYYNWKDYDRAIRDFTEAIRLNPQYAIAYYNRGLSYFRSGNYRRAIADYEEALQIDPDHPSAAKSLQDARDALARQKK